MEEATGQKFTKYKAIKYIRAPYSEGGKAPPFVGVAYYVIQVKPLLIIHVHTMTVISVSCRL